MKNEFSIKEFLKAINIRIRPSFLIDSREKLAEAAKEFGILPFFPNNITGLSVEEMCAPGMLFGGNYDEGCWEWKGPVIRRRESAYGKFFRRKAGFVSLQFLPDFLNYRRSAYPVSPGSVEEMLLDIIKVNDSLTSTELKEFVFGRKKRTSWDELPDQESNNINKGKRKSLESPLQRLQMGGWIVISDFEYKTTKRGERYGWGVARYSTPEFLFGDIIEESIDSNPKEALKKLISKVQKKLPFASKKSLELLLK